MGYDVSRGDYRGDSMVCESPAVARLDQLAMRVQDLASNLVKARERAGAICGRLLGPQPVAEHPGVNKVNPSPQGKIAVIDDHVGYLLVVTNELHGILDWLEKV